MIKPINLKEMILRVRALLRRAQLENKKYITIENTELDYAGLTVTVNGVTHDMPPKEFYLLFKLLNNPNKIFTWPELSIVKRILELLNGVIECQSIEESGTKMTVNIQNNWRAITWISIK